MKKFKFIALSLCLALGLAMVGCGSDKSKEKDTTATEPKVEAKAETTTEPEPEPKVFKEGGIEVELPADYYAEMWDGGTEASIIHIYSVDEEAVKAAREASATNTAREIPRILIFTYGLNSNHRYAVEVGEEMEYEYLKNKIAKSNEGLSGLSPLEEIKIGDIPFVMYTGNHDGLKANYINGVVDGCPVLIKVVGEGFKDSQETKDLLNSIKFNGREFYNGG